jgi:uncharacterized protein (DUF433 family)
MEEHTMTTAEYAHISFNADKAPIIAGTQTKVLMVVMDHIGHGWDAQEIHRQYPCLSLGQIHSALAYYYDHKAEFDARIEQDLQETDRLIAEAEALHPTSSLRAKLKAPGQLP